MTKDLTALPNDLPAPIDDGACDHLTNKQLPHLSLPSTQNTFVDLSAHKGWLVIYCYPMTGKPGMPLPPGWNDIPGARGCTPQSCNFRDHYTAFTRMNVQLYGLSTQSFDDQKEAVTRLELPYPLLSDSQLVFARALNLPTFQTENIQRIKRLILIAYDGTIRKFFYPVFPPDKHAEIVLDWLEQRV